MQATERAELDAMRDLYVALDSSCEVGDAVCGVVQRLPQSTMLNRALGVGHAPATEEKLDEIVAAFAGRGCVCAVAVAPEAQPAELPAWLRARGFEPGYAWMKFSRRVGDPPTVETDLRVEGDRPRARGLVRPRRRGSLRDADRPRVGELGRRRPSGLAHGFEEAYLRPNYIRAASG